jgi:hypothetical protein
MHGTRGGLRRLAILFAVATVGVLAVGAQAASAQVIEICKSSANGMSGRSFQYSITGGASVTVNGGRCSGPITVAGAQVTITEAQSNPATDVAAVTVRPSLRKLSENLPGRSVTVTTGASTASETLVTFTNQPAGGNYGTLKVCKLTETPAYLGRLFSFSANGGPLVSTEANDALGDPANWSCRILGTFQVGSNVTVHEAIPAGTEVQFIDSDPATALADFNTSSGDALVTVGAGVTVVLYDDEPLPPTGTGWLEICKDRAVLGHYQLDPDVHGVFHFTVTDAAGATYTKDVYVDQCSEPFQVAAGIAEVTEGPSPGYDLVDVATIPSDRLLTTNLINRTADVEVPASDSPNDETQVHFFNQTQRGQLKICKALGPGSSDLIGQRFYFDIYGDGIQEQGVWITAAAQTQCVIVGNFPIGSTIDVEETCGVLTAGLLDGGDCNQFIDVSGEGEITIAPGINTKTITNTARGLLEICKAPIRTTRTVILGNGPVAAPPAQPTFHFRVDGGGVINVRAGTCSLPMRVSVGTHTVTENAEQNYELDPYAPGNGITVNPADREISRNLATRTVTVNVPYGPNGETLVTFYNRVKLGQVKICKQIPLTSQDALSGKLFDYDLYFGDGSGSPTGYTKITLGPIYPGECTSFSPSFPVIYPNGRMAAVGVVERPDNTNTTYDVVSIALTSGTRGLCSPGDPNADPVICNQIPNPNLAAGIVDFYLGPGPNVITYTNKSKDP